MTDGGSVMLIDMVRRFQRAVEENPSIILDNYQLKEGIYIRFHADCSFEENIASLDQNIYVQNNQNRDEIQHGELYTWFKIRDYYSSMLNGGTGANKLIDLPKKQFLHTNGITLFMKEKLLLGDKRMYTPEQLAVRVQSFYNMLQKSDAKFMDFYPLTGISTREKQQSLMERETFFKKNYPLVLEALEDEKRIKRNKQCESFLVENMDKIFFMLEQLKQTNPFEGYVKIFFAAEESEYHVEYAIYALPRIFTVNEYNYGDSMQVVGLPSGDLTVNSKKPFFVSKTTRRKIPLRISVEKALIRKDFFTWLEGQGKFKEHVFSPETMFIDADTDCLQAYHVQINKDGGIEYYENVPFTATKELRSGGFICENILDVQEMNNDESVSSLSFHVQTRQELQYLMSQLFFRNRLHGSILQQKPEVKKGDFTYDMKSVFLQSRQALYDFFVKGTEQSIRSCIAQVTQRMIEEQLYSTVKGTYVKSISKAFNLRLALLKYFEIGGNSMGDRIVATHHAVQEKVHSEGLVSCGSEREFYYLVGQLSYYLLSQSETRSKTIGVFEPIVQSKYSQQLKRRLETLLFTYGQTVSLENTACKQAMAMVMGFELEKQLDDENKDMLLAGLLANNLFNEK